ncbi:MAG TPA: hypothetical protein V6C69_18950 [Trichormus sp.]|jgi:hypothetical protein
MLKHLSLALVIAASTAPLALADGSFDLSGYQTGAGNTMQGINAQANFNVSGDPAQWNTPQFQANIAAPQFQANVQLPNMQADLEAPELQANIQTSQPGQQTAAGGAGNSGGTTGMFGNTSSPTGTGPMGMGGLTSQATSQQRSCGLPCGTMGLAPVFGYGGGSGGMQSPGGYVSGIQIPGLGLIRVPSTIGLPGGGAIGLPQINNGTINGILNGN